MKFRRWGPYVWWICPSRKCNFENKTDLAFVQGEFQTKCQYCNTPIIIRMKAGQLDLESLGTEEEEAKPAAPATMPKPLAPITASQSPASPSAPSTTAPAPSTSAAKTATPPSPPIVDNPPEKTQTAPTTSKDPEPTKKTKDSKKKAAS